MDWLKEGVKVKIPRTKMGVVNYNSCVAKNTKKLGQNFLYYIGRSTCGGNFFVLTEELDDSGGDFFLENEIEAYEEVFLLTGVL